MTRYSSPRQARRFLQASRRRSPTCSLGVRTFGLLGFVLFDQNGVNKTQTWRISSPAAYAALRQDAKAYMKLPS